MRVQEIRDQVTRGGAKKSLFVIAPGVPPTPPSSTFVFERKRPFVDIDEFEDVFQRRINPALLLTYGPTQYVNIPSIPSSERWPLPTITGGFTGPQLFIAGALNFQWNPQGGGSGLQACTITSQTIGRSTLTVDIFVSDGSYAPVLGQTVLLQELGITLFAGCIDTIVADREIGTAQAVTFHITALDKSSICDHRVCTAATYATGLDVAQTIDAIVNNFLNGEGINTNGVPQDGSLGELTSDLILNYNTVTDAFNQIATQSGTVWWIDQYGQLFFSTEANLPAAPFQLNETTTNVNSASGGSSATACSVTSTLSGAGVTTGYRNQQFVVSNLNILPGSGTGGSSSTSGSSGVTETFTFTVGDPGIISQYVGGILKAVQIQVSLPISQILAISVNGNPQTVYEISSYSGQMSTGSNDYLWFYNSTNTIAGQAGSNQGVTAQGILSVPVGATVVIQYLPGTTTNAAASQVGSALVPTDPHGGTFGTCGSGIFQSVLQVKNISTQADLNAIAQAELSKSGGIPSILHCFTNQSGLFVGQQVQALFPNLGLGSSPVNLLITAITATASGPIPLNYGSIFTFEVTAVSNLDPGNWITYFTNMVALGQNPLPVLQYEEATFILAPSGSLTSGVVLVNPYIAGRTGLLCEIMAAAANPPTGQNLVLTITANGTVIGTITILAGTSTLVDELIPASDQIYVFAKQILGISAAYTNIGVNPVAAANVTVKVRWSM